ncbi:Hypothetical predicted protein [Pelobates cultripes]|uniref:Uncharacterized protein n=1 Tax=Pelobates cultripes TaxID=61616 RepID=A0AAD1VV47_PELCU|nr:Hypothetical predicted protein [Pelobates cultripes]
MPLRVFKSSYSHGDFEALLTVHIERTCTIFKEILVGSVAFVIVTVFAISMLGVYLALYKYVLHPKTHLPSNLILQAFNSKTSMHRGDETIIIPSTFESMVLTRHILEAKEGSPQSLQYKRYVSNEPVRNEYVNCELKKDDHLLDRQDKNVELKNPTYATKTMKCSLTQQYPYVCISSQHPCKNICFSETREIFDFSNISKKPSYINTENVFGEYCTNTGHEALKLSYMNQVQINQSSNTYFNQYE